MKFTGTLLCAVNPQLLQRGRCILQFSTKQHRADAVHSSEGQLPSAGSFSDRNVPEEESVQIGDGALWCVMVRYGAYGALWCVTLYREGPGVPEKNSRSQCLFSGIRLFCLHSEKTIV